MVVNARLLKKMKRRITVDLYDFLTFPPSPAPDGKLPFRTNVKVFLNEHALLPPPSSLLPHLLTWQISFRIGEVIHGPDSASPVVCLDVVEEDVATSRSVYCDQCRVVGWSGNPVCSKRYHFIIKADGASIGGCNKPCTRCGEILQASESRCQTCNHVTSTQDIEDWIYQQLEDTTHLLHGVIHANGHGHLLRVNGREGGSRVLSGRHIMDFWDRLCVALGVRNVSVMDVSKKYGLDYRLLHAITKGHSWYGDWGYEFGAGSFALTLEAYKSAVETLSTVSLSSIFSDYSEFQDRVSFYQSLTECQLVSTKDLIGFLMSLIRNAQNHLSWIDAATFKRNCCSDAPLTWWRRADIDRVNEAMFRVLRAVTGTNWVSSRALRGAVCRVASSDLLDYCTKELGGKFAADGMVINARQVSGVLEFRLEPGSHSSEVISTCSNDSSINKIPSFEVLVQDLRFFYKSILHPQTMLSYAPKETRDAAISSAEKLLDCKQFVKEYKPEKLAISSISNICLSCKVQLLDETDIYAPPEMVILPLHATVSDLKRETAKVFQEVYLVFKRFEAEELIGYSDAEESTKVRSLELTDPVGVRGRCGVKNGFGRYRMERGTERWTVDCICGAKDDDGERMLACDVCGVWQHTRCSGIHDSYSVPARFVCRKCPSHTQIKRGAVQG